MLSVGGGYYVNRDNKVSYETPSKSKLAALACLYPTSGGITKPVETTPKNVEFKVYPVVKSQVYTNVDGDSDYFNAYKIQTDIKPTDKGTLEIRLTKGTIDQASWNNYIANPNYVNGFALLNGLNIENCLSILEIGEPVYVSSGNYFSFRYAINKGTVVEGTTNKANSDGVFYAKTGYGSADSYKIAVIFTKE